MFAVAFDLVVAETLKNHQKSVSQAYADIAATLATSVRDIRAFRIEQWSDFTQIIEE